MGRIGGVGRMAGALSSASKSRDRLGVRPRSHMRSDVSALGGGTGWRAGQSVRTLPIIVVSATAVLRLRVSGRLPTPFHRAWMRIAIKADQVRLRAKPLPS